MGTFGGIRIAEHFYIQTPPPAHADWSIAGDRGVSATNNVLDRELPKQCYSKYIVVLANIGSNTITGKATIYVDTVYHGVYEGKYITKVGCIKCGN
jgi:hypothetical protein